MITVIFPVHNEWFYTQQCIKSICLDQIDEIIVVDNASTDETAKALSTLPVRAIYSEKNLGFGEACNLGLQLVKSEYVYLLNNDTILNKTTITALLDRILSDEKIGAVGSKVIWPNGQLIEAGCYFVNGAAIQRGCQGNPDDYNDFELVDYCSTCSLLIRKKVISEGFDERFSPGYYDDVDLCFQIRKKGYLVGYEPLSTIIHYEGITFNKNKTDRVGLTERNRIRFLEKWSNGCSHRTQANKHDEPLN
jgi:GT2 family glycosyltransferase